MIVKDYMTKHPVMIDPAMSIVEAQSIMAETKTRHLPVVGEGQAFGGFDHTRNAAHPTQYSNQPECVGDHSLPVESDGQRM